MEQFVNFGIPILTLLLGGGGVGIWSLLANRKKTSAEAAQINANVHATDVKTQVDAIGTYQSILLQEIANRERTDARLHEIYSWIMEYNQNYVEWLENNLKKYAPPNFDFMTRPKIPSIYQS